MKCLKSWSGQNEKTLNEVVKYDAAKVKYKTTLPSKVRKEYDFETECKDIFAVKNQS